MKTDTDGCHTVVISSKKVLFNALHCYNACNEEGIALTADYKWKLTKNGWPLGVLGSDVITYKKGDSHSMIPFIFGYSTSESIDSFDFLLKTFSKTIDMFFNINDFNVVSANIDHSQSLRYKIIHLYTYIMYIAYSFCSFVNTAHIILIGLPLSKCFPG